MSRRLFTGRNKLTENTAIESLHVAIQNDTSPKSLASVDSTTKRKIKNDTWVQCENPKCLKWRRISKTAAEDISNTPWYCFMNDDQLHSSCEDKEENYTEFEKLAKKCRLKYVSSALIEGTLVMARMAGYCSWPGIITKDPSSGIHITTDCDENPSTYHVEFLGEQHSHSWVHQKNVELYGTTGDRYKSKDSTASSLLVNSTERLCGRRRKGMKLSHSSKKEIRKSYRGKSVEFARTEADALLDALPHERLEKILFKVKDQQKPEEKGTEFQKSPVSTQTKRGRPKQINAIKAPKKMNKTLSPEQMCQTSYQQCKSATTSPLWLSRGTSLEVKLNECASLQGRSKEEKFAIDMEINRKNQNGFEHDLNRFMRKQGLQLSKAPRWKDIPVTFYQVFVAVHERGGYEKVNIRKQWAQVYKEVTNYTVSNAVLVKKMYWKNLLPYELYISGKEYNDLVQKIIREHPFSCINTDERKKKRDMEKVKDGDKGRTPLLKEKIGRKKILISSNKSKPPVKNIDQSDSESEAPIDDDMRIMFQQIEETGKRLTYDILENSVRRDSERLDLNIRFYDDENQFTASGTESAKLPEESAQIVPELVIGSGTGLDDSSSDSGSDEGSSRAADDGDNQVLNEMEILQHELDIMHRHMLQHWQ